MITPPRQQLAYERGLAALEALRAPKAAEAAAVTRSVAREADLESSATGNRVRAADPGASAHDTDLQASDADSYARREGQAAESSPLTQQRRDARATVQAPRLPDLRRPAILTEGASTVSTGNAEDAATEDAVSLSPEATLRAPIEGAASPTRDTQEAARPEPTPRSPEDIAPDLARPDAEKFRLDAPEVSLPDRPELPEPGQLAEREPIPLPDRPAKPGVRELAEALGGPSAPEAGEVLPPREAKPGEAGAAPPVDAEEARDELGVPDDATAQEIEELERRDAEVRQHELAHSSAGAGLTGPASFEYARGPDGRNYAVAGEVPIDVSPVSGDPEATLDKMSQVKRAALAPAEPSGADRRIAALADAAAAEARAELQQSRAPGEGNARAEAETKAEPAVESASEAAVASESPTRDAQATMLSLAARRAYERAPSERPTSASVETSSASATAARQALEASEQV